MKISSIATTAIFALALVTAVSVDAKSKAPSMSQVCAADIQANCADKKGKAVKSCLKAVKDKLSPECAAKVTKAKKAKAKHHKSAAPAAPVQ
ncbi:MAG: hypothetical protein WCP34_07260 [Pseudomonadota bacterium]